MAHAQEYRAKLPALLTETSEKYFSLLKKQMPKDLDEAKDMAMKLYNSVVELIHAKIPIGKKDEYADHHRNTRKISEGGEMGKTIVISNTTNMNNKKSTKKTQRITIFLYKCINNYDRRSSAE